MNGISRRKFLKYLSKTSGALALSSVSSPALTMAQSVGSGSGVNVVVVNLEGGMDGLAAFPIYSGSNLSIVNQELRPSLAVDPNQVISIHNQTGIDNKVGLHPEFQPLVNLAGNRMKIIQGYGIPGDPGRSHDTCQVIMSLGRSQADDPEMRGFLARLMDTQDWDTLQYWALGDQNPSNTNTTKKAPVRLEDLDGFDHAGTWYEDSAQRAHAADLKQSLLELHTPGDSLASRYKGELELMHNTVALVRSDIANQSVGNNSAGEYGEWGFGAQLRDIAKILKAKVNNTSISYRGKDQVFLTTHGGFDTHSDQANANATDLGISQRIRELATNLAVFYRDLALMGLEQDTYIILYSEFGRTLLQNAPASRVTAGTDHGHASTTMVIGGRDITSGVIGDFASSTELRDEWYNALRPQIDYRDIFAEIFREKMGISPNALFPESGYSYQKLGIIS